MIAGRFWFEACAIQLDYRLEYVHTHANLADGPSRENLSLLQSLGACEVDNWSWPSFGGDLGGWLQLTSDVQRTVQH